MSFNKLCKLHCGYAQTRNNKTLTVVHTMYISSIFIEVEYFNTIKEAN